MELKKKDIDEIINTNGELIGNDDIPSSGADLETAANNTTDYNMKIGTQPFRYDMLGRFGFTLMPFMEGEEKNEGQQELLDDISDELFELYVNILEDFYRKPNKVKTEFRAISTQKVKDGDDDKQFLKDYVKFNFNKYAEKLVKVIEKHFDKSMKSLDEQFQENIVESKVLEDKMVDKKEDEMSTKSDDREVSDKKIKKIAGLINKLEMEDKNKLINLLEKNG